MADNVVEEQQQAQVAAPDFKAELDQMMAISLNGGVQPEMKAPESAASEPNLAQTETQVQTQNAAQAADPFGFLKEKFGYENHEAAIKEIEGLRAFKEQPRLPEFVYENEESANILKALSKGDKKPLYEYLHREHQIERLITGEVTKETASDIVKMRMQLTNDLTPQEIEYQYKKQFGVPPQPVRGVEEEDSEYNERVSQWQETVNDRTMDLIIAAKMARPDIAKSKGQLSVPQIETQVDEGYAQYQQMLAQKAQEDVATKEAYKSLTSKAIETKLNFKDEANKIDFEFQFEPDAEGFSRAVETACDAELFYQTFANSDGTPNRQKFLDAIYYANNKDKIIMSAINQGKNAAIKASLPDNSQGGILAKQVAQSQEPNELDQQMRVSLRGHGGF